MNDTEQVHRNIDRRNILELLVSIVGGLGLVGTLPQSARSEENSSDDQIAIDDSYLVKGLTGMARAKGWFDAHWGAGILAGYYLCHNHSLGKATTAAIRQQLDVVIRTRGEQFAPFTEERFDKTLIEEVPNALRQAIDGGLRAHGHAVIFASLSMRALRDVPQMAQPKIIRALCELSHQIAEGKPQTSLDPAFVYPSSKAMIDATFDSLVKFKALLGRPSIRRPNFTHMVTHTEALLNLEWMGYGDLAKMGHAGQRTHISSAVPVLESVEAETHASPTLRTLAEPDFWNDKINQDRWNQRWNEQVNPNGDWIASGHLFKVLYSFHRLIKRVPDRTDIELCSSILLERYVNPDVQGG